MVEGNRKRVCATRGAVAGPGATPCLPGAAARRSAATASEGPGDLGHETDHLVLYLMVRLQPTLKYKMTSLTRRPRPLPWDKRGRTKGVRVDLVLSLFHSPSLIRLPILGSPTGRVSRKSSQFARTWCRFHGCHRGAGGPEQAGGERHEVRVRGGADSGHRHSPSFHSFRGYDDARRRFLPHHFGSKG